MRVVELTGIRSMALAEAPKPEVREDTDVLLKVADMVFGLRVTEDEETEGLDIVAHDERGYNI